MPSIHPAALDRGAQTAGACSLDPAARSPLGSRPGATQGAGSPGVMAQGQLGAQPQAGEDWGGRGARLKDSEWEEVWVWAGMAGATGVLRESWQ